MIKQIIINTTDNPNDYIERLLEYLKENGFDDYEVKNE
jgi:hypothetical protein